MVVLICEEKPIVALKACLEGTKWEITIILRKCYYIMLIVFSIVKLIYTYTCYIIAIKAKTLFKKKALVRIFKNTLRRKKTPKM